MTLIKLSGLGNINQFRLCFVVDRSGQALAAVHLPQLRFERQTILIYGGRYFNAFTFKFRNNLLAVRKLRLKEFSLRGELFLSGGVQAVILAYLGADGGILLVGNADRGAFDGNLAGHSGSRTLIVSYFQHLKRQQNRYKKKREIAKQFEIFKRDNYAERNGGEKEDLIIGKPETENERYKPEYFIGRRAHPTVRQKKNEHQKKRVERIYLNDRRLRPFNRRKSERESAAHAACKGKPVGGVRFLFREQGIPFPVEDKIGRTAAYEHGRATRGQSAEHRRAAADRPRGIRMPHICDKRKYLAEYPCAERPERIPRRMRYAEMGAGGGEFSRVFKTYGRTESIKINTERNECRNPKRSPVKPGKKALFHDFVKHRFS